MSNAQSTVGVLKLKGITVGRAVKIEPIVNWRRQKRDYRKRCLARGASRRDAHRFSMWALAIEYVP